MKIKHYSLLAAALVLLPAGSAFSADNLGEDCKNPQTQSLMNQCAAVEYNNIAVELKQVSEKIKQALTKHSKRKENFKKAQAAWNSYKTYECKVINPTGGTATSMLQNACQTKLIKERIKTLQGYLNCPEGETQCMIPR